ncbi:hypothetical protein [Catenuloplanes atrovinosus]|uniref:Lipoprotein n=1 Tax=Catenuloplanes atrovinosus TaxID=137266 RepID=A0AAE3YR43_9ACTN|nr:hypothetical protein [Catenuloplanes atrovinosus]MDR7276231.1 hypothetical protein [Catenuloplanes atrovinosus]
MFNGDTSVSRRRMMLGVLSFAAAGVLATACAATSTEPSASGSGSPAPQPVATGDPLPFGPEGFGHLTVGMKEEDALATGDLQAAPISTVLNRNVYSFVGGPEPDPSRMAADEELEDAVAKADDPAAESAKDSADAAKLYADSTKRTLERMVAFLEAGGASFRHGYLDTIAAPKDAATAEGIKRGSSRAELETAYENRGLAKGSDGNYKMPAGREWQLIFEMDGNKVKYMSLARKY